MPPIYLPQSRRILPRLDRQGLPARPVRRSRRRRLLGAVASSPLLLGLCLMVSLLLIFPKALGEGFHEGGAV
jgi:hypothetical protein